YRDTGPAVDAPPAETLVVPQEGPVSAGVRAVVPAAAVGTLPAAGLPIRRILKIPLVVHLLPQLFLVNLVDRSLFLVVPLSVAGRVQGGRAEAITGLVVSAGALASAASAFVLGRRAGAGSPMALLLYSLSGSTLLIAPMTFCRSLAPFAALRVLLGLAVGGALTLSP